MRLLKVFLLLLVPLVLILLAGAVSIGLSVRDMCGEASISSLGDDMPAKPCRSSIFYQYVVIFAKDTKQRKDAIWAMGQLSDEDSFYWLDQLKNNNTCKGDKDCDYELDKAIKWSSTGRNVLSPLWRRLFL